MGQLYIGFYREAHTALQALAQVLGEQGKPEAITLDRDPRWVGGAGGRDFPSAFLRLLLGLGIQPKVCPPHRPDLNAEVSRYYRTLKQECLLVEVPTTEEQVRVVNERFVQHYNQERPHQALSCGNQPPRVAFANLPALPALPELVDPDAWLAHVDGQHFIRKIRPNGTILLDEVSYESSEPWPDTTLMCVSMPASKNWSSDASSSRSSGWPSKACTTRACPWSSLSA